MARPLRIHVPGGFYHVTLRGNHRLPIFFRDSDRNLLNDVVADTLDRLCARLHAYCWMTNHIHLLLQVSDVPLGSLILRIAGRYARSVQRSIDTTGHLFERRYHAVLVDADAYLLTLVRYIHMNPVRAAMVSDPSFHLWSSHGNYLGTRSQQWVTTRFALGLLSSEPSSARRMYAEFVCGSQQDRWGTGSLTPHPENSQVLGDDVFLAKVAGSNWRPKVRTSLDELMEECSRRFSVLQEALASPCKNHELSVARAWLARQAVDGRVASVSAVARRLGRTEGAVRRLLIRRFPR
jgi:REP element-mobilizing transposase RayT